MKCLNKTIMDYVENKFPLWVKILLVVFPLTVIGVVLMWSNGFTASEEFIQNDLVPSNTISSEGKPQNKIVVVEGTLTGGSLSLPYSSDDPFISIETGEVTVLTARVKNIMDEGNLIIKTLSLTVEGDGMCEKLTDCVSRVDLNIDREKYSGVLSSSNKVSFKNMNIEVKNNNYKDLPFVVTLLDQTIESKDSKLSFTIKGQNMNAYSIEGKKAYINGEIITEPIYTFNY